jgi:DNA polymerase III epsilon subunit-like protein
MVAEAPAIDEVIGDFVRFIEGSVLAAHHAAFDLGFLAIEIEKTMTLPSNPVICSSLLSRQMIKESHNHRLQTLVRHLKLEPGTAHRALDDSVACLEVALECCRRVGENATLQQVLDAQEAKLTWQRFSMDELLEKEQLARLIQATRERRQIELTYGGGSKKGKARQVEAMGLVRSLDGDYFVGFCLEEERKKRYQLDKIIKVELPA